VDDADLPLVVDRTAARLAGLSDAAVSRRLTSGRWTSLRRGAFAPRSALDAETRWRAEIVAARAATGRPLVLSHAHAARAHALPSPLAGWGTPTFTAVSGSRRYGAVKVLVAALSEHDVVRMGRVPVTSVARTVVDCARILPGRDALAVADAALHRGLVTPQQLAVALAAQQGWPGAAQARLVVALADGRRETPLESWSAWAFAQLGVPPPRWQVTLLDADGVFLGRVDAWWDCGVAGEADGRAKYALPGADGHADEVAAVHDERLRETSMRRTGAGLVRWGAVDVLRPRPAAALGGYLCRELGLPRDFTGRVLDVL
jgi:hypothetical protein